MNSDFREFTFVNINDETQTYKSIINKRIISQVFDINESGRCSIVLRDSYFSITVLESYEVMKEWLVND